MRAHGGRLALDLWYWVPGATLLALLAVQTWNQQWSTDMWLHLSAVRELALHPWSPNHPVLPTVDPDPYLSPYALGVALLSRVTGWSALTALQVAAVANGALLLAAYRRFVTVVGGCRAAAPVGLAAVVLLWGPGAWRWSGFLNLGSLGYGLPYPSTFAIALMLLVLAELDLVLRDGPHAARLIGLAVGLALVVLSHPITGIATVLGMACVWIARGRRSPRRADLGLAIALAGAAVLAVAWPHYSVVDLLLDQGDYGPIHDRLFEGLALRLGPLVAVAALVAWLQRPRLAHEPLLLWGLAGLALVLLGRLTDHLVLGRAIGFAAPALQTWVAVQMFVLVRSSTRPARSTVLAAVAVGSLALVSLVAARATVLRMVPRSWLPGDVDQDERVAPLVDPYLPLDAIEPDAVVLTWPAGVARAVPALSGKTTWTRWPVPFVDDAVEREADARRFFSVDATEAQRRTIVARWGATTVAVDTSAVEGASLIDALRPLGEVQLDDGRFVVIDLT